MPKSCSAFGCNKRHGDAPRHGEKLSLHKLRGQLLADFSSMLTRLRTSSGEAVLQTRKFTPILGLCLSAKSVMDVSATLLEEEGFQYVLPYKMSQDHLELLFGRIRRMGGHNNNPNAVQLQHAMRRLTLHNFISPSATGNCIAQDDNDDDDHDDGLLRIRRPARQQPSTVQGEPLPAVVQHLLMTEATGSAFVENCVGYIAGYVCRKLMESGQMKCAECVEALMSNPEDMLSHDVVGLINVRDNGGLIIPSASAYYVVAAAERHLTVLRKCNGVMHNNLSLRIQCSVIAHLMTEQSHKLFPGHQDHMYAPRADECHAVSLIRQIVARYLRVRLYSLGQNATLSGLQRTHIRHSLYKQVLFAHQ